VAAVTARHPRFPQCLHVDKDGHRCALPRHGRDVKHQPIRPKGGKP
jgi:hypothetical protein